MLVSPAMKQRRHLSPIAFPVLYFAGVICLGTVLLHSPFALRDQAINWLDALFTATSATCVTGLVVVDTGTFFSRGGQLVILALIQLGGLGIMTFTSLAAYLWRHRISITDRVAVGQGLLHDPDFHLGRFLKLIFFWTLLIELGGALLLTALAPRGFTGFSAMFHSVSAFCNAGFGLHADSLTAWRGDLGVNLVIMGLIILGGLGFSVLTEMQEQFLLPVLRGKRGRRLSWYSALILRTSCFLVLAGGLMIYLGEMNGTGRELSGGEALLSALFQSVSCRTAGFNTLEINRMTNVAILVMIVLMFIGGAPGSCAGGIKVTTFRTLWAFLVSHLRARDQAVVGRFAVDRGSVNSALTLLVFAVTLVLAATLLLDFSEGGNVPHDQARGLFLEIVFEVVSAFGTVGLSTGLTAKLSQFGRLVIISLMFIGRLGPLVLLASLQSLQRKELFLRPEKKILIG